MLRKNISISESGARERDAQKEYVRISYYSSSGQPVVLTGWTTSNTRGGVYQIGRASIIPGGSSLLDTDQVVLEPGGSVYLITGQSPRGESFRSNKCIGYFNQFRSYTPSVPNSCPQPRDEPGQDALSDACYQFIRSNLSSCTIPFSISVKLDDACRSWIDRTASYAGCLANHRTDKDFYSKDWWVYLNRPDQIWSDVRDTITLKDYAGNIIATRSYQ